MLDLLINLLFANAFIALCIAFYFHAKLVLRIMGKSNPTAAFMSFLNGQIHQDLKPNWSKSVFWAFASFAVLFVVVAMTKGTA